MIISINTTLQGQNVQPADLTLVYDIDPLAGTVNITIQNAVSKAPVTSFTMDVPTFTQMVKVLTDAL